MYLVSASSAHYRCGEECRGVFHSFSHLFPEINRKNGGKRETIVKHPVLVSSLTDRVSKRENRVVQEEDDLGGHESAIGVFNDGGESAVIVEKHHYFLPHGSFRYFFEHAQCRGMTQL